MREIVCERERERLREREGLRERERERERAREGFRERERERERKRVRDTGEREREGPLTLPTTEFRRCRARTHDETACLAKQKQLHEELKEATHTLGFERAREGLRQKGIV